MKQPTDLAPSTHPKSHKRKLFLWIAIGIVVVLAILYVAVGGIAANTLTVPQRVFDASQNPGVYNMDYQEFTFPARTDNLTLAAWYIPSETNEKAIVLVHGRDDSRTKAFGGKFISFAAKLQKAGYSVLMFDLRGHGLSADSRFSYGLFERRDVLGAVDWLLAKGFQPGKIGVLGYSLGGASVIGAAAEEKAIGAIWVDSSYKDMESMVELNWVKESGLPKFFWPITKLMIRLLYGYDVTTSKPIEEIASIAPRPIFLAHCQNDELIPNSDMSQLAEVANPVGTWLIPGCSHALGYPLVPDEYNQKVIHFFDTYIE